jgi:hypothetical protein
MAVTATASPTRVNIGPLSSVCYRLVLGIGVSGFGSAFFLAARAFHFKWSIVLQSGGC